MYQKILSVWLCFSLYANVFAQDVFQIKGSVVNANTLQPIEGATISGNHLFSISSSKGLFSIDNVRKGPYTFTVSHMSYTPKCNS